MINKELVINKMADIQKYLKKWRQFLNTGAEIIDDNLSSYG